MDASQLCAQWLVFFLETQRLLMGKIQVEGRPCKATRKQPGYVAAKIQYETQMTEVAMGSQMPCHQFLPGMKARVSQMQQKPVMAPEREVKPGLICEEISFRKCSK